MKNSQALLVELLKEMLIKGNESEFLNLNEFMGEMEHMISSLIEA
jgi:hypothetical protein